MKDEKHWQEYSRPGIIENQYPIRVRKALLELPDLDLTDFSEESIYICGETGFGKTILAYRLMLANQKFIWQRGSIKDDSDKCVFVSIPDLFQSIKDTYGSKSEVTERDIIEKYKIPYLVIFDEFGLAKPTDWALVILYQILNYRYDNMKKCIFTSNFTLDQVAEIYGDVRLTSRINQMCTLVKKEDWRKTSLCQKKNL